jgi:predicted phosphoribosyltransferase
MYTTLKALEKEQVKETIVAVPTSPESAIELIKPLAQKIVCLNLRSGYTFAVADAYKNWYDLDDSDVIKLMNEIWE